MAFGDDIGSILPNYLVSEDKVRLKEALSQFKRDHSEKEINYDNFYKSYQHDYFMQADLVREIRMPHWDDITASFIKTYPDAIIISNTCDISFDNHHNINNKQCLLAPIIDYNEYLNDLKEAGYNEEKLDQFSTSVKAQLVTNLFYLPQNGENKEHIVFLDKIFWFPTGELNSYLEQIEENRITTLGQFGYYLFILKLSYHLCRLPEQCDRELKT